MFSAVKICILQIMMLNTVVSLRLDVVEQLIVLMFNVLDHFLSVVVFNIMWVVVLVVLFIQIVMIQTVMIHIVMVMRFRFPVTMSFVVSLAVEDWLMNTVVNVEMSVVLNAMRIVVQISMMDRVERVCMRRVVVATSMRSFSIVVCIVEVITSLMVVLMVWSLVVYIMHVMNWMVSIMMVLMGCHFVVNIIDLVR